jgi:stage II sporulation SpoM-like protein
LRFKIKRRLLYLGLGAAVFLIAYSVGAAVPMSDEEAAQVRQEFADQIGDINENGIFVNNVRIALGMFIPAAGAGLGIFSGFATGSVFSALAHSSPELAGIPPLAILITPFGIMEVVAYGIAMSRSGMLVHRIVKDKPWRKGNGRQFFRNSLVPTFIEMGIVAVVLFAGAVVEWAMIQQLGGLEPSTVIGRA